MTAALGGVGVLAIAGFVILGRWIWRIQLKVEEQGERVAYLEAKVNGRREK